MEQNDKRKKVILDLMGEEFYIPMKEKELAVMLQVSKEDRSELNRILNELLTEGKISITKKGKFIKAKHAPEALIGTFISHPKGLWLCGGRRQRAKICTSRRAVHQRSLPSEITVQVDTIAGTGMADDRKLRIT